MLTSRCGGLKLAMAACAVASAAASARAEITVVDVLPTEQANGFYQGNRDPLLPSPLIKLPIGKIKPAGWLRRQLELMADGMIGHLEEISQWCNFDESAWTNKNGEGKWNWEEMPYWIKGYGDLGYVLHDERITVDATKWLKAIMASQREDGSFGPRQNIKDNDLWPHMCVVYALRSYYEATGDKQALETIVKWFKYVASIPPEKLYTWDKAYGAGWWQWIRAADHLDCMHWAYNQTGEKWLLDLAAVNHRRTADWTAGIASWHGVNLAECWRGPAQFYPQSHDIKHLQASIRNYDEMRAKYGQVPGGMYGADENCREGYTGPRQGTETCSFVEMMYSHEVLLKITGETLWADRCEDVALNSFPASCTPDQKGLHYLTCPNQISCDRQNKAPMIQNGGDMFSYTPYEQYRCCQHNVAMGWPYYAEHIWFATPGNGLAAALYAPSEVTANVGDGTQVTITENTSYPFDDRINFTLHSSKPVEFALALRVPAWCTAPRLYLSKQEMSSFGQQQEFEKKPGSWIVIKRQWQDGDVIWLQLPMAIKAHVWEKNHNAVSIERGPLTYSLKIGEEWKQYDNGKKWAAFEVLPTTPWNYALVIDPAKPEDSVGIGRRSGNLAEIGQPFTPEAAPITLTARAKRVPEWQAEENGLVGAIQDSPVRSDAPTEEIELVPMGCTRLRISAFPMIGEGPDAKAWKKMPPRVAVTASWCNPSDTLTALFDGKVPASSADQSVPRFTWWDHRGTEEWVEIAPPESKPLHSLEVYWFDDTGTGSCRVPAEWSVVYRTSKGWEPVKPAGPYGVEKDTFNKVEFEPITPAKLRILVKLQPGMSGGILECRLGQ